MSVYDKEQPRNLSHALRSIYDHQVQKPDEIVLVLDGPLSPALMEEVEYWRIKLLDVLKLVPLEKSCGLGVALQAGLERASNELIARMDSDDVSVPERFSKQISRMAQGELDVLGSFVLEFVGDTDNIVSRRMLPIEHAEILRFMRKRNPLNHPSVVFRKSAVVSAGGYLPMSGFEDYYLWARMAQNGSVFGNLSDALVKMRCGNTFMSRRRGWDYAVDEYIFQREILSLGLINRFEFVRNVVGRVIVRISPPALTSFFYSLIRKNIGR